MTKTLRASFGNLRERLGRYGGSKLGLNYHVFTTLAFRGWSIGAGGLTLLILPVFLSPTEQGYYYTFANVLALQIFFELGLNQVITQFVSHEAAHLRFTDAGILEGSAQHLGRLGALVRVIRAWYLVAASLFFVLTGLGGWFFFGTRGTLPAAEWSGVWVVLIVSTAINLRLSPLFGVIEGCGRVGQVAKMRLQQSVLGYLILWTGLFFHVGLWAAAALPVVTAAYSSHWLWKNGKLTAWLAGLDVSKVELLNWRKDIFPMQWRIAVSWVAGYFLFNLFTPIVFAQWGAVQAGKIGLALAIFSAISTVGMSWVNATAPKLAMHVSRGERAALNRLFVEVLMKSTIVTFAICVIVLAVACGLSTMELRFMTRVASLPVLACLACVTIANSVIFSFAVFMRSHKEEPMLPVSAVSALLTIAALYFGVKFSVAVMMTLYLAVTVLVALPWTTSIFFTYFRRVE